MQIETWKPSARDKRRAAAFGATPAGKRLDQHAHEECMKSLERQLAHGTYTPDDPRDLEKARQEVAEWRAARGK